jgi:GNAT superfamily N-acetyltransferase
MRIDQADVEDVPGLAALLWMNHFDEPPSNQSLNDFSEDISRWWSERLATHLAFVARDEPAGVVGMAWVALVARVPRPGLLNRMSADIQSVFVTPEYRGRGIGSALVEAATRHASQHGSTRTTVHSGRRAVAVYERLGFASSPQLLQRPLD